MTACPSCGTFLTLGASDCAKCGHLFGKIEPEAGEGPKGIGGWLILPLLGLIVSPIRMGYQFVTELWPGAGLAWQILADPQSPHYHPLGAPLLIFELAGNVLIFAFGLWVLACFVTKSTLTPLMFIIWISSFVVLHGIDLAILSQIPAAADALSDPQGAKDLVRAIVGAVIWVAYFLKSKRVANTFVD